MALVSLAIVAAAQGHDLKLSSTVSLTFTPNPYGDLMSGRVSSTTAACKDDRTVTLFRAKPGPDQRYSQTETRATGKWKIVPKQAGSFKGGRYYARVRRSILSQTDRDKHVCRGDTSPKVTAGGDY